jgi:hypothetical protein
MVIGLKLLAASGHRRRKAIHSASLAVPYLPLVTMPEDSYCSATAVQEEMYAT